MIIEDNYVKGTCNQLIDYLTNELSQVLSDRTILLEDKIILINNTSEVLEILCYNYLGHEVLECVQTPMGNWVIKQ